MDREEIVCVRKDNALVVERVAAQDRTDKRQGEVRDFCSLGLVFTSLSLSRNGRLGDRGQPESVGGRGCAGLRTFESSFNQLFRITDVADSDSPLQTPLPEGQRGKLGVTHSSLVFP